MPRPILSMAVSACSMLAVLLGQALVTSEPAPAPSGAMHTDTVLSGTLTAWGHSNNTKGGNRKVGADALARVDLFRELWAHAPSAECKAALADVLEARDNLHLWALKMQDASARLPDALLAGAMHSLGDYDGCASVPSAVYCLPDVVVRPPGTAGLREHPGDELSPYDPPNGKNATLWDLFEISGNRRRYRRDLMQWGVCLPAACGPRHGPLGDALAASLDGLAKALRLDLLLHLDPNDCTDFDATPGGFERFCRSLLERPLLAFGSIFVLAFPVLALMATVRAARRRPTAGSQATLEKTTAASNRADKLDCFDIKTNWSRMSRKQPSQIHSIQGLRTITMFLIIFGHRGIWLFSGPVSNPEYLEDSFVDWTMTTFINGNVIVSTFFVISGFLEARSMIRSGKQRRYDLTAVLQNFVIRSVRLLPALAVMLAVEVFWVEFMGDGPLWNQVVAREVRDCKTNWWAHLLFVNNYYSPDSWCLVQTWFVCVVMQLFVITSLLMWLVSQWTHSARWTRGALWPGCLLLGLVLAAAGGVHYATTISFGLHPMLQVYPQLLRRLNMLSDATFVHQYVATNTNAVPYVVGLIVGALFSLAQQPEWRPSERARFALFATIPVSLLVQVTTVCLGVYFFLPTFESRPLLDAVYGPLRLFAFSLPTALLIFTCGIGAGGVFERVLTWRPMMTLGRLTYSVYLVHLTFVTVTTGHARHPEIVTAFSVGYLVLADIVCSYGLGLVLHLCVEAPCANLQGIAMDYWSQKSHKPLPTKETPLPPKDFEDADDPRSTEEKTPCLNNGDLPMGRVVAQCKK